MVIHWWYKNRPKMYHKAIKSPLLMIQIIATITCILDMVCYMQMFGRLELLRIEYL